MVTVSDVVNQGGAELPFRLGEKEELMIAWSERMAILFIGQNAEKRSLPKLPLPLGEAGRRPGEGAFCCGNPDESTLTPSLSQREREKH